MPAEPPRIERTDIAQAGFDAAARQVVVAALAGAAGDLRELAPYLSTGQERGVALNAARLLDEMRHEHETLSRPHPVQPASHVEPHSPGAELVAAERQRQMTAEGWTPDHDDEHASGELVQAAKAYAHAAQMAASGDAGAFDSIPWMEGVGWPWDIRWFKPSENPIGNLVKAGALIAAEIDRLQRRERPGRG